MPLKKIACATGCVLLLVSCAPEAVEDRGVGQPPAGRSTSKPAGRDQARGPDFVVQTFDGESFSLAEHRGSPVVLNFWESW